MKLFFPLILLLSGHLSAQSEDKLYDKVESLFQILECKSDITIAFNLFRNEIDIKRIFLSQKLDYSIQSDVDEFSTFLDEDIPAIVDDTYNTLIQKYSSKYTILQIDSFIQIAKKEKIKSIAMKSCNLAVPLGEIIWVYGADALEHDMRLKINTIKAKYEDLKLVLIVDGLEIDTIDFVFDLLLTVNTPDTKPISILNKHNKTIIIPSGIKIENTESITILYKEESYNFKRNGLLLPKELQDITSCLSPYCFNKLLKWTITIDSETVNFKTRSTMIARRLGNKKPESYSFTIELFKWLDCKGLITNGFKDMADEIDVASLFAKHNLVDSNENRDLFSNSIQNIVEKVSKNSYETVLMNYSSKYNLDQVKSYFILVVEEGNTEKSLESTKVYDELENIWVEGAATIEKEAKNIIVNLKKNGK